MKNNIIVLCLLSYTFSSLNAAYSMEDVPMDCEPDGLQGRKRLFAVSAWEDAQDGVGRDTKRVCFYGLQRPDDQSRKRKADQQIERSANRKISKKSMFNGCSRSTIPPSSLHPQCSFLQTTGCALCNYQSTICSRITSTFNTIKCYKSSRAKQPESFFSCCKNRPFLWTSTKRLTSTRD